MTPIMHDIERWKIDLDKYFFDNAPTDIKPPELTRNNIPKLVIFKSEYEKGINEYKLAYEQLQKQNHELIKALEFYADKENYEDSDIKIDGIFTWYMKTRKILEDDGEIAREVLAKFSKGDL